MTITILKDHVSPETAYVVADYPYGFRLRCKIRYWLEYAPKLGFRLCVADHEPKKTWGSLEQAESLNIQQIGGCMYLDGEGHVQWSGLDEYCDGKEAETGWQPMGKACRKSGKRCCASSSPRRSPMRQSEAG